VSKAFTSEENESAGIAGRAPERVVPGAERPITPDGYATLAARRDAWIAERRAVSAGSDRAAELDHRIAVVTATLENVRVVLPVASDGTARFGSRITLRWDDGRMQTVTLVGPDEAEGDRVSVLAPLGRAHAFSPVGSTVEVVRPRGAAEATILAVE
jgi:transcription elongation GreA/GreB family factor